jgi:tRNA modification GTPase
VLDQIDTIAAISTPPGIGGIGIIRVSGPLVEDIARNLFHPRKPVEIFESRRFYHGDIVSIENKKVIDEVLVVLMRKPNSYTGEDILEIHCHGGPVILQSILGEILKAGAGLARPGEFTERAFLNGRLDLVQAEAVMDMISARTDQALDQAVSLLKGRLSDQMRELRSAALDLLAGWEVLIDFPDEEDAEVSNSDTVPRIDKIICDINSLLLTYREGKLLRDGVSTVITGRTNVGKSSLLNRILEEERAIVTAIPGTTRDFLSESININGIPMTLTDTAGIRESEDTIERIGIKKVWEKLESADAVIFVVDGSTPLADEDRSVMEKICGKSIIVAVNKKDLPQIISRGEIEDILPGVELVSISAKYGDGIDKLREKLYSLAVGKEEINRNKTVISNIRHKDALEKAREKLLQARQNMIKKFSADVVACDLREALGFLGEIVGESTREDVLERIFSNFCIGK